MAPFLTDLTPNALSGVTAGLLRLPAALQQVHAHAFDGAVFAATLDFSGCAGLTTLQPRSFAGLVVSSGSVLLPPSVTSTGSFEGAAVAGSVVYGVVQPPQLLWLDAAAGCIFKSSAVDGADAAPLLCDGLVAPHSMDVSADGEWVWWTDSALQVVARASAVDGSNVTHVVTTDIVSPAGLAVGTTGWVYWGDSAKHTIERVWVADPAVRATILDQDDEVQAPVSLALQHNGAAYIMWADSSLLRIQKAHRDGQLRLPMQVPALTAPTCVANSPDDNAVFYVDSATDSVQSVSALHFYADHRVAVSGLQSPRAVAVSDDSMLLFVSEAGAIRVADARTGAVLPALTNTSNPATAASSVAFLPLRRLEPRAGGGGGGATCATSSIDDGFLAGATVGGAVDVSGCPVDHMPAAALHGASVGAALNLSSTLLGTWAPNASHGAVIGGDLDLRHTALARLRSHAFSGLHLRGALLLPVALTAMDASAVSGATIDDALCMEECSVTELGALSLAGLHVGALVLPRALQTIGPSVFSGTVLQDSLDLLHITQLQAVANGAFDGITVQHGSVLLPARLTSTGTMAGSVTGGSLRYGMATSPLLMFSDYQKNTLEVCLRVCVCAAVFRRCFACCSACCCTCFCCPPVWPPCCTPPPPTHTHTHTHTHSHTHTPLPALCVLLFSAPTRSHGPRPQGPHRGNAAAAFWRRPGLHTMRPRVVGGAVARPGGICPV